MQKQKKVSAGDKSDEREKNVGQTIKEASVSPTDKIHGDEDTGDKSDERDKNVGEKIKEASVGPTDKVHGDLDTEKQKEVILGNKPTSPTVLENNSTKVGSEGKNKVIEPESPAYTPRYTDGWGKDDFSDDNDVITRTLKKDSRHAIVCSD